MIKQSDPSHINSWTGHHGERSLAVCPVNSVLSMGLMNIDRMPIFWIFYYSWFIMFCQFLLYNKVIQLYIYIYIHSFFFTLSFIMFHHKQSDIVYWDRENAYWFADYIKSNIHKNRNRFSNTSICLKNNYSSRWQNFNCTDGENPSWYLGWGTDIALTSM